MKNVLTVAVLVSCLVMLSDPAPGRDEAPARPGVVADGAKVVEIAGGFKFTEGPAADAKGNLYFTDIPNNRIHRRGLDGKLTTFSADSGAANGLFFDRDGSLLACQGGKGRLVSIDMKGKVTVLADTYGGKRFNKPNDLWPDPKGGIYFSDPVYGRNWPKPQGGEHVYYLTPDRKTVIRVIDDMVRPNGIIGTPDGKTLYVTDHGGKKTFRYTVKPDGTLADKKLFAPIGSDGMTIDTEGNVYLTEDAVLVYSPAAKKIAEIPIPQRPSNVCFGGKDGRTLFVTARRSVYSIRMRVRGVAGRGKAPAAGVIGVSVLTTKNPFFNDMTDGMKAEADKHGWKVIVADGDLDPTRQQAQVRDFITRKCIAIVLTPCNSRAVGAAIKEANDAKIPALK